MGESRERFNKCLEIIEGLWLEPNFSYQGKFYTVKNVTILPRRCKSPRLQSLWRRR